MFEVVRKGSKKCLQLQDLYKPLDKDKSKKLGDQLEKHWNNELLKANKNGRKASFLKALSKTFILEFMWYGLLWFIQYVIIRPAEPLFLAEIISLFSGTYNEEKNHKIYMYSALLVVCVLLEVFFIHHTNFGLSAIGMRVRVAASSIIYRKITRLNKKSLGQTAAGQVINLLSNDVNRFDLAVLPLHAIWVLPFQIALFGYITWRQVGISSLLGIISMIVIGCPFQGYLGKLSGMYRSRISIKTDKRVKIMSEVISGIQVIKMYAWERPFEKIINLARAAEIKDITTTSYLRGVFASCMVFLDKLSLFLTVICYVLLGHTITADIVFSLAKSFNILQMGVAIFYPMAISYGSEALISVKRLEKFLELEEKEDSNIGEMKTKGITLSHVKSSWTEAPNTLKDITLKIPEGTLCAIVGPVGSGKSSLLQLLLGELPAKSGNVKIGGEISYSSQEPWLFQSSVRQNILFGMPYEESWYDKIVKVCALESDFKQLPNGDRTIVGERGVSLSGGQRARINLARAVYRHADIYLMDDPLSAVDTHVGKHLFQECIINHLKGKTRILVTHQLQYLKMADLIVVINEGRIEAAGTFDELSKSDLDFTKLLVDFDETNEDKQVSQSEFVASAKGRKSSILSIGVNEISACFEFLQDSQRDEEESGNDINSKPFRDYIMATKNMCLLVLLILLLFVAQALCAGSDLWVAFWTSQEELRYTNNSFILKSTVPKSEINVYGLGWNTSQDINSHQSYFYSTYVINETKVRFEFDDVFDYIQIDTEVHKLVKTDYAMYFYGILILGTAAFTVIRTFLFFKMCLLSSINLHSKIFHTLLKAPMRFFDVNPSGRVLNRFSKDIGAIDEILPRVLLNSVQIALVMFGIMVNVALSNPYIIITIVTLGVMIFKIRRWNMDTAKAIKHLEGKTKSPVFSHINSTLNGIITIRASHAEDILIDEFDDHQDVHTSAWFLTYSCTCTFGLWVDLLCLIFMTVILISFIFLYQSFSVSGSMVGLAISQSLILTNMVQVGMNETSEVINQLTSVERIMQYTQTDTEGPFETPKDQIPKEEWPQEGLVVFKNLSLKYIKDDPPVLNNLNFSTLPGEKIGIVGRTGAGKSSLIAALFRLAPMEGSIIIDGIDTKDLGLSELRKKISIIPQEPVLFSATLRYNLDPFAEFEDNQIWQALELVELKDAVESLDLMVSEGGSNFSLGQRQLICLARASLRSNKILVLDEATANVDLRTDSFIQSTIRKRFKNCTIFTIAHRLNTIMDSDKVLVMSFGEMVEFDHPHKLLQIPDGYFHNMVLETGPLMSMQLKDVASLAYNSKIRIDVPE